MIVTMNKTWRIELDEADAIALGEALDIMLASANRSMIHEEDAAFDVAFRLRTNLPKKKMEVIRSGGGWTPPPGPK